MSFSRRRSIQNTAAEHQLNHIQKIRRISRTDAQSSIASVSSDTQPPLLHEGARAQMNNANYCGAEHICRHYESSRTIEPRLSIVLASFTPCSVKITEKCQAHLPWPGRNWAALKCCNTAALACWIDVCAARTWRWISDGWYHREHLLRAAALLTSCVFHFIFKSQI